MDFLKYGSDELYSIALSALLWLLVSVCFI